MTPVVEALCKAGFGDLIPEPLNIGSGKGVAISDLSRRVLELTGWQSRLQIVPARQIEVTRFVADIARARQVLSLEQPADPLFGLAEMVDGSRRPQVAMSRAEPGPSYLYDARDAQLRPKAADVRFVDMRQVRTTQGPTINTAPSAVHRARRTPNVTHVHARASSRKSARFALVSRTTPMEALAAKLSHAESERLAVRPL